MISRNALGRAIVCGVRAYNRGIYLVFEHEMEAAAHEGPNRGPLSLVETPAHPGARKTVSDLVCLSTSGRQTADALPRTLSRQAEVERGAVRERERSILHRIETRRFLSPPQILLWMRAAQMPSRHFISDRIRSYEESCGGRAARMNMMLWRMREEQMKVRDREVKVKYGLERKWMNDLQRWMNVL